MWFNLFRWPLPSNLWSLNNTYKWACRKGLQYRKNHGKNDPSWSKLNEEHNAEICGLTSITTRYTNHILRTTVPIWMLRSGINEKDITFRSVEQVVHSVIEI